MKCLLRNKTQFAFANIVEDKAILEDGYDTGQREIVYGEPTTTSAYISPASGVIYAEVTGVTEKYDKTITTEDLTLDIRSTSVLWIDQTDTTKPYDYIVQRISKSLNYLVIRVKKVDITNG